MSQRVKMLPITLELLIGILQQGGQIMPDCAVQGLPTTARVAGTGYDHGRRCCVVYLEDDSFPEVPDGQCIGVLDDVYWVRSKEAAIANARRIADRLKTQGMTYEEWDHLFDGPTEVEMIFTGEHVI